MIRFGMCPSCKQLEITVNDTVTCGGCIRIQSQRGMGKTAAFNLYLETVERFKQRYERLVRK